MAVDQTPPSQERRKVALLAVIPDDMYAALITDFELLDAPALAALSQEERTAITVGLTRAMVGAKTEEVLALPGLKTIASIGAGIDKFDFPWLAERGISVHPTPDIMTEDTAEFAVGLVFAAFRNIVGNDRLVRRGDWAIKGRAAPGKRISGSKIGIVGLGRIGSRIATKLSAIGCEISYTGTTKKDVDWQFVPNLADMATAVDALILSCVGGDATRGLISADVLDRLGPDGFVINVARGSVVNEEALINALQTGVIAGAALDVFENEPSPDPRFFELGNCILQPHTSVFTNENRRDLAQELTRLLQLK